MLADGFPLWQRASPVWSTAPMAFLWAVIQLRISGRLPDTFLLIPTCSADADYFIVLPVVP